MSSNKRIKAVVNPKKDNNNISDFQSKGVGDIEITLYTDPLCIWSWAFEPQLVEIKLALGQRANWSLRMGGLISSWNNFHDEVNSVNRPAQMGPVWMHAGEIANRPVHHQLWIFDPPASSYPSCIAVKCAQLQSAFLGEEYLKLLREICMIRGKNIARRAVLDAAAIELSNTYPEFDTALFKDDYNNENGMNAFRSDLDLVRSYNINRFPAMIIKSAGKSILVSGYRHSDQVLDAIKQIVPDL